MRNNSISEFLSSKPGHFDICLMNPPYDDGITKGVEKNLHAKFTLKCIEVSDKIICVMPIKVVKNETSKAELTTVKELYDKTILSVEEVNSDIFIGTHMPNVGIYFFSNDKKEGQKIKINYLNNTFVVDSLLERISINETEKQILSYLECDEYHMNWNYSSYEHNLNYDKQKEICTNMLNRMLKRKRFINRNISNPVFLFTNAANGGMNGTYLTNKTGIISKDKDELIKNLIDRNGKVTTILVFNSIKEAENCKIALQNNVLRMACYKNQVDQTMKSRVYKYIPNIDWSDDRVKTDEGLLEVCGCPREKCKEYAEYCKKVIEEVDNKY